MLLYHCFTDILLQSTLVNFLYTSVFITMNPIDLSCKVTSTTSNEVISPKPAELTSTTSNEDSPNNHQTGINTNLPTYVLYQNRLIKIPSGLRLKQPKVYFYNELITVPSGITFKYHRSIFGIIPNHQIKTLTGTLFQSTLLYHQLLCKN